MRFQERLVVYKEIPSGGFEDESSVNKRLSSRASFSGEFDFLTESNDVTKLETARVIYKPFFDAIAAFDEDSLMDSLSDEIDKKTSGMLHEGMDAEEEEMFRLFSVARSAVERIKEIAESADYKPSHISAANLVVLADEMLKGDLSEFSASISDFFTVNISNLAQQLKLSLS